MKNLSLILAIAISIFMFSCKFAPSTEEALECNKYIMNSTGSLDRAYDSFKEFWNEYDVDTFDVVQFEALKTSLQTVKQEINTALTTVNDKKDYEGIKDFTDFKGIALDYYKAMGSMCDKEYTEIIDLLGKGEEFTETDRAKCFELDSIIGVKHQSACDVFIKFQEDFAKKYDFELEDTQARDKTLEDLGIKQ
ncbi:MAG: hypothetical protein HY951_09295 [Bacteroidia bacterium]|nr:hypothetical protein [Bacteroidia bacterium]